MKATIKIEKEVEVKYLKVVAHVRYWEDAEVNGAEEDDDNPTLPFNNHESWMPVIDVDNGCIVDWPQGVTASVHYKVCDEGVYTLLDADKNVIKEISSYVPDCLSISDSGYGDYICMDIDENGHIDDWVFDEESIEDILARDFSNEY